MLNANMIKYGPQMGEKSKNTSTARDGNWNAPFKYQIKLKLLDSMERYQGSSKRKGGCGHMILGGTLIGYGFPSIQRAWNRFLGVPSVD